MEDTIRFEDVKKIYKMGEQEIEALAGVDFTIKRGQFVIIAGASGAGKSTILNILGGMDTLSSGRVHVYGKELSRFSQKEMVRYRRFDVGFVFQFYNLVQNLTAKENIELASQIGKDPLNVDSVLEGVGLSNRKQNFPSQLSGGEQQRVAIARALAKNPKILLCDEPTGALDYETGRSILKLLQETAKEKEITVIVITHNLALVPMGDLVIKIKSGLVDQITENKEPLGIERIEW
ncbi:MAG: ABC transporter ATP-binding protein [Clostridium sp.]|nr:ABC transporter ATP-binding protein [Clostridium sp.]